DASDEHASDADAHAEHASAEDASDAIHGGDGGETPSALPDSVPPPSAVGEVGDEGELETNQAATDDAPVDATDDAGDNAFGGDVRDESLPAPPLAETADDASESDAST